MSQARAILSLVSTGLGIGIVPEERRNACFDNVVFRPIPVGSAVKTKFHAIWRSDNRNSALLQLRGPRAFDRISGLAIETRLFVVPATNSTCEAPVPANPAGYLAGALFGTAAGGFFRRRSVAAKYPFAIWPNATASADLTRLRGNNKKALTGTAGISDEA